MHWARGVKKCSAQSVEDALFPRRTPLERRRFTASLVWLSSCPLVLRKRAQLKSSRSAWSKLVHRRVQRFSAVVSLLNPAFLFRDGLLQHASALTVRTLLIQQNRDAPPASRERHSLICHGMRFHGRDRKDLVSK